MARAHGHRDRATREHTRAKSAGVSGIRFTLTTWGGSTGGEGLWLSPLSPPLSPLVGRLQPIPPDTGRLNLSERIPRALAASWLLWYILATRSTSSLLIFFRAIASERTDGTYRRQPCIRTSGYVGAVRESPYHTPVIPPKRWASTTSYSRLQNSMTSPPIEPTSTEPAVVFISYSHDSTEHAQRVR